MLNTGLAPCILHWTPSTSKLYQSSHIFSNPQWDNVRYLLTECRDMARYILEDQNLDGDFLLGIIESARLSQQQRLFTSPYVFVHWTDMISLKVDNLFMLLQLGLVDGSVVALVQELHKRCSLKACLKKIMKGIILLSALAFIPGPYKLKKPGFVAKRVRKAWRNKWPHSILYQKIVQRILFRTSRWVNQITLQQKYSLFFLNSVKRGSGTAAIPLFGW